MTDKDKALASIALVLETCKASILPISRDSTQVPPELPLLHKDMLSLLSVLDNSTTKLALALKPSSPTYSASLIPLKDISSHIGALAHCANQFDPIAHGATLLQEVVSVVKDVIESIKSLMHTFLSPDGPAGEYLVKIGTVHEIIDKARGSDGISGSNVAAVRKKWAEDKASLEDGLREVSEMVREAEEAINVTAEDDDDNDQFSTEDDGWGDLGLGSSKKMDQEELARTQKVHTLLRLTTLLHKRIDLDLLSLSPSTSSTLTTPPNPSLDDLSHNSSALLSATDDLVSNLYPPHDSPTIRTELAAFVRVVEALQIRVREFFPQAPAPVKKMGELSLNKKSSGANRSEEKKGLWFDTCFDQVFRTSSALALTLGEEDGT